MASSLKVGFVFDDSLDKPDGVQQYVLTMGRWLSAQGHDVHYLVGETVRDDLPNIYSLSRNVKVRFNQNRMAIPLPVRMQPIRDVLAREQFDILHVQVPYSPALAGRILKAANNATAIVGTFHIAPHSALVTAGNRALGLWVRQTLARFDIMTATSKPAADFARKTFKLESTVVPLPVPLERFVGAKGFERYNSGKAVVFLGRLVERKGCQHLLKAVAYAVQHTTWPADTRVVVCGGGPLEPRLKQFVQRQGLGNIVEFTGYITEEDKPRYLASADVVAYPSTGGESFGIVLLEAMAASPGMVLAGNNPGYASVMAPRPESLFEPRDTATFAAKLVSALQDTVARKAARAWQRDYVQQFDISNVGAQTVAIYEEALRKRHNLR
ncbi:MAG TPA: glycosyltransferase family 4 protein [Candidatus Saccharimonadales bacterium]|nr:glycosyltransferase family 4 protein [Candidatus Saccharimonadales bacterium]